MLPGLRFFVAAVLLSLSMLVFGLGATALLRSAHEEFASLPTKRGPGEMLFAPAAGSQPALAMLRVDDPAPASEQAASAPASDVVTAPASSTEPEPAAVEAVQPDPAPMTDLPKSQPDPAAEVSAPAVPTTPTESVATPAVIEEEPAKADVAALAVVSDSEPTPVVAMPATQAAPVADDASVASTKIATLGGPPVEVEPQPATKKAAVAVRKKVQVKRPVKRHRVVARRPVQAAQQPADPFAQPLGRPSR